MRVAVIARERSDRSNLVPANARCARIRFKRRNTVPVRAVRTARWRSHGMDRAVLDAYFSGDELAKALEMTIT
ncbi:MAG TPA: hypothetical protein PKN23_07100, partial [Candidatus Hydrogenedentes bacterium]|nr:hypothetical protein [Candidatus Hydrogenedentota bacterium]